MRFVVDEKAWDVNKAAEKIRAIAKSLSLTVTYTKHARERMLERGLIMGDVLYVLKNGFVHLPPQASTRPGYHKYAMECRCPNGGNRAVRVVVIPESEGCFLKIATVMWVDEPETRSGSIIGETDE
jgi:hypothetical protein